jgi:hypothetical protein
MSDDKRTRLKQWLQSGEARLQPLTFPQRELWETSPWPVEDTANHICCIIPVQGLITPEDCRAAIQRVVDRQEVLRLSFLPGKESPVQLIRETGEANMHVRELSGVERTPDGVEEVAREIFSQPFDLLQGPLYRVGILRRAADDHVMVLAIHHAIADGWSLGVFVRDLGAAYVQGMLGMREPLGPPDMSYSAWGAAERGYWQTSEIEDRAAFWKSAMSGAPRLWTDLPGEPIRSGALERRILAIRPDLTTAVRNLARQTGSTLFSTLLSVFQITLSRWTGSNDIVVGSPVANRGKQAMRETMGYCSGVVPIRSQVDYSSAFVEFAQATHQCTVDSFAHAIPFAELIRVLGEAPAPGYNPIYQVRFALQNHPVPDVGVPGLSARLRMRSTGTPRCDLGCEITEEGDALEVVWLSRSQRFAPSDIDDLDHLFRAILGAACRTPESSLASLLP